MRLFLCAMLLACTVEATEPVAETRAASTVASLVAITWTATGGTITSDGVYRAGNVPGIYRVIGSAGGKADTATACVGAPSTLTLDVHNDTLAVGDTLQLNATVTTSCDVADTSIVVTWVSRSPSVATVASTGTQRARVTAVAQGTAWIVASAGSRRDSALVCVGSGLALDVSPATLGLEVGHVGQLTAAVTTCGGAVDSTVTWTSRNTGIATVATAPGTTQTANVTAVAAGSVYVVADEGGVKDSALVTVTAAPAVSGGCPTTGYLRLVTVSTSSQLGSAVATAVAGDQIRMAAGTYSGISWSNRDGTAANPITLCGPSTAVIRGDVRPTGIDYWRFQGFSITGANQALYAVRATHNHVLGLTISSVGQEAIHFLCNSTDNVIEGNDISNTGTGSHPEWGEGVYIGTITFQLSTKCGSTATDASHRNQIIDNTFGPNVRSEDFQAQPGSNDGVFRGNTSDGTGKATIVGQFEASVALSSGTSGWVIEDNDIDPAAQRGGTNGNGIYLYSGSSNHRVQGNTIDMTGSGGYGIRVAGSGHHCDADNVVTNGTRSNVACAD